MPEHVALRRAELPRGASTPRSSSPTTRTRRASASATSPCPAGLTDDRFDGTARTSAPRSTACRGIADKAAGDPVAGARRVLPAGLRPDRLARGPGGVRHPPRAGPASATRYGRNPFGQRALLARRLVEAGVPFVTLYDGGWDHHTKLFDTLREAAAAFEARRSPP